MATKATADEAQSGLESFEVAFKILTLACGPTPTFYLSKAKSGTMMSATLNGSAAAFRLPLEVANLDTPVEVPTQAFMDAIRGKKKGNLTLKGNTLAFEAGAYSAKVNIVNEPDSNVEIVIPEGDDVQTLTLTPELQKWLSSVLVKVRIEKVHNALPDAILGIRLGSKSWHALTWDSQRQLCHLATKPAGEGVENISLTMFYSKFTALVKDLPPVANLKLVISPATIAVVAKSFRMVVAMDAMEEDSFIPADEAFSRAKEIKGMEIGDNVFNISAKVMTDFLANSRSYLTVNTAVQFTPRSGGTELKVVSPSGETKLMVKGESVQSAFCLDHRFVAALLAKQAKVSRSKEEEAEPEDDTVSFAVVNDTFVICRNEATYVAVLSDAPKTEDEKGKKKKKDEEAEDD